MDSRKQFTFYRSFWEAVKGLPKKDRLPILEAIISYGLDGEEPAALSQSQFAFFLLVKPVLDSGRKKATSGKQGGSKPKANGKQTAREKEIEKEVEIEKEIEKESLSCDDGDGDAREASESELARIGLRPGQHPRVTKETVWDVIALADRLFAAHAGGRYLTPCDYRNAFRAFCRFDGQQTVIDPDATGLLEYALEQAELSGCSGQWRYINGILSRLAARDIHTREEAEAFDAERPDKEE